MPPGENVAIPIELYDVWRIDREHNQFVMRAPLKTLNEVFKLTPAAQDQLRRETFERGWCALWEPGWERALFIEYAGELWQTVGERRRE